MPQPDVTCKQYQEFINVFHCPISKISLLTYNKAFLSSNMRIIRKRSKQYEVLLFHSVPGSKTNFYMVPVDAHVL